MSLYDTLTRLGIPLGDAQQLQDEFGHEDADTWLAGMRAVAELIRDGASAQPSLPPTVEPWRSVHAAVLASPSEDAANTTADAFEQWPGLQISLNTALVACYLKLSPRAAVASPAATRVPPLPPEAQFEPAPPPTWLTQYVEYADCVSPMTPRSFHESAGLWLLSTAVARRLVLRMHYGPVYPNLYVCWVAGTTLYRKTTALNVARTLVHKLLSHLQAPSEATPEALLTELAGREPNGFDKMSVPEQDKWRARRHHAAQRGWIVDELSGLLAQAGRDYNQGLLETVLRLYDCEEEYTRSTRGQGQVTISAAYLALIGATTPMAIGSQLTEPRLWSMGWWPRFAILTPDSSPTWREPREPSPGLLLEVESGLSSLLSKLPRPVWPVPATAVDVMIDHNAHELWSAYNRALSFTLLQPGGDVDERLAGSYGRLPTSALKVAILFAALAWRPSAGPPRITEELLRAGLTVAESWRASAHRALDQAAAVSSNQLWTRILTILARYQPDGATLRDLHNNQMRDQDPDKIENALRQLAQAGEVEMVNWKPAGGGRPTRRFRLA